MNELSTSIVDQPAFTQDGRKGIAYDWQSLLAVAPTQVRELASAFSE